MDSLENTPSHTRYTPWLVSFIVLAILALLSIPATNFYNEASQMAATRNPVVPVYSPDGAQLAVMVGKRTEIFDTTTNQPRPTRRLTLDQAAGGTEAGLVFSADGRTLQVNRSAWDTTSGAQRYRLEGAEAFRAVYSPDGSRLAVFSFDGLYIWDAASGEQLARIPTPSGCSCQTALAFIGSDQLVSAAIDGVKTWRIADGDQLAAFKREGFSNALALSSDGRLVAFAEGTTVELWDVTGGQLIRTFEAAPGNVNLLTFSPDDRRLAGDADKGAAVWDVESGQRLSAFSLPVKVAGLAFTPDGARLAVGAYDGKVRMFEAETGQLAATLDLTHWGDIIQKMK